MSGGPTGAAACERDHSHAAGLSWVLRFPCHPTGTLVPTPARRSSGAVGSVTQPGWATVAAEGW